jgi:hypothetical protein
MPPWKNLSNGKMDPNWTQGRLCLQWGSRLAMQNVRFHNGIDGECSVDPSQRYPPSIQRLWLWENKQVKFVLGDLGSVFHPTVGVSKFQ